MKKDYSENEHGTPQLHSECIYKYIVSYIQELRASDFGAKTYFGTIALRFHRNATPQLASSLTMNS